MDELIYRDAMIEELEHYGVASAYAEYLIKKRPAVNPESFIKRGSWIIVADSRDGVRRVCSACKKAGKVPKYEYCPYCGAKMGGV